MILVKDQNWNCVTAHLKLIKTWLKGNFSYLLKALRNLKMFLFQKLMISRNFDNSCRTMIQNWAKIPWLKASLVRKTMYTMDSGSNVTCQFSGQPKRIAKGADESRLAIRDREISTIFADWKQTGNICGRSDKACVFTNFYTVVDKQRRFHEVALHLEPPCRLMTFSYRFLIFSIRSHCFIPTR